MNSIEFTKALNRLKPEDRYAISMLIIAVSDKLLNLSDEAECKQFLDDKAAEFNEKGLRFKLT